MSTQIIDGKKYEVGPRYKIRIDETEKNEVAVAKKKVTELTDSEKLNLLLKKFGIAE